jgi:phage terminase large subunit-like protein
MINPITVLLAERERRHRQSVAREAPKYDWYGSPCDCGPEMRKSDGSCREHERARDKQRPPEGDWEVWLIRAGRAFGKTRTGAEWIRHMAATGPKKAQYALIGETAADVRDIMIQGPSGLMKISPPWFMPTYEPSKRSLTWPNGVKGLLYSAQEPGYFRGPQFHGAWCDEFAKWSNLEECWDNLQFGMRLVSKEMPDWIPRTCITTTPLPLPLIKKLIRDPKTAVVSGSLYENAANLAKSYIDRIRAKFEGTRFGRQEIFGEILEDTPGALWNAPLLDDLRVHARDLPPDRIRIGVGVDPSVADPHSHGDEGTAECGITVGFSAYVNHPTLGMTPHGYLLADRSLRGHPVEWARAAVNAYHEFGADFIVAEKNNGGAMVASTIQTVDPAVPVRLVWASKGKITRAEPVAALYEQRRIFHMLGPDFTDLESQMCSWVPGLPSPDRMDSLVWLFTELMLGGQPISFGPHPFPEWD